MNIDNLTIDQLVALRDEVSTRLQSLVEARQESLREESDRLSAINGGTVLKPSKRLVKYRKGSDAWSGNGSQPAFIKQHLALGGSLDELKV